MNAVDAIFVSSGGNEILTHGILNCRFEEHGPFCAPLYSMCFHSQADPDDVYVRDLSSPRIAADRLDERCHRRLCEIG